MKKKALKHTNYDTILALSSTGVEVVLGRKLKKLEKLVWLNKKADRDQSQFYRGKIAGILWLLKATDAVKKRNEKLEARRIYLSKLMLKKKKAKEGV